jgi:phospholipase D1/2
MFLPTSNRLAGFLEISAIHKALSVHLAQSGGTQYKAGYLRIVASGNKGAGFGRKSASRSQKRKQKWCAMRPTRYYRQGLNLLHGDSVRDSGPAKPGQLDLSVRRSADSATRLTMTLHPSEHESCSARSSPLRVRTQCDSDEQHWLACS